MTKGDNDTNYEERKSSWFKRNKRVIENIFLMRGLFKIKENIVDLTATINEGDKLWILRLLK